MIELVTVMSIVAILTMIGIPSYRYVTNTNRIASEDNGLLGDLQFARAEAIKEGQTVSVCVSSDGATCLANDTNWHKGWIVFSDPNGNATVDAGTDTVLRVQLPFGGTDTFVASNNASAISFNREGFAAGLANGTLITLHAAPVDNSSTRCLSVSLVGLMAIQTYGNNGCT